MKSRRRLWLGCFGTLLLALLGFYWLFVRDDALVNNGHLFPPHPAPIDDEANLHVHLGRIRAMMDQDLKVDHALDYYMFGIDSTPVPERAFDELERQLNQLGSVYNQIEAASRCTEYRAPELLRFDQPTPNIAAIQPIKELLAARVELLIARNRIEEAIAATLRLHRLGATAAKQPTSLNTGLLALSLLSEGNRLLLQCSQKLGGSEGAKTIDGVLAELPTVNSRACLRSAILHTMRVQYYNLEHFVESENKDLQWVRDQIDIAWLPSALKFKPNRTRNNLAALVSDSMHRISSVNYSPVQDSTFLNAGDWERAIGGNALGDGVVSLLRPAFAKVVERVFLAEADQVATRALLLVRQYELLNGELPNDLRTVYELRRESPPLDPYDGQPLRYSKKNQWVYSVGNDLTDRGGDRFDPRDPTWRLDGLEFDW